MTKAQRLLDELKLNAAFLEELDSPRKRALAEALVKAGTDLSQTRLKAVIAGLAKHSPETLIHAVARGLPEELCAHVRRAIRSPKTLQERFFLEGLKGGVAQEAATLLMDLGRCSHVPGVIKHLGKRAAASADLVVSVRSTLKGRAQRDWADEIRLLAGLLGVLVQSGDEPSLAVVQSVRVGLARYDDEDEVHDTNWLVERLVTSLGKRPAKAVGAQAARASKTRRAQTDAVALAKALKLSLAGKPRWRVSIWLARGEPNPWFGALQKGPQVHLELSSEHKPDWKLDIRGAKSGIYSNWAGKVSQDDFGLPPIGGLEEFPSWVLRAGKVLRARFSMEQATVDCGRYRASVEPLRRWLDGPELR